MCLGFLNSELVFSLAIAQYAQGFWLLASPRASCFPQELLELDF